MRLRRSLLISFVLTAIHNPWTHAQQPEFPTSVSVKTAKGVVRGATGNSVAQFLGIPYAAPPVGELRWRLPRPALLWQGVRDTTQFGPICPQPNTGWTIPTTSEDCLYLNVYAPFPLRKGRKVMVWVHGGTNTTGAGSFYDPTPLVAAGGVIVVTLNYRLGALGFLAHPALMAESGTTGNYGLADQQMALHWVRENIVSFGGDAGDITLFGESSGGMNVLNQLISPAAAGLFQKVIVESGSFQLSTQNLQASEKQGLQFGRILGCTDQTAACLRSKTTDEVLTRQGNPVGRFVSYALATVDGNILPASQSTAFPEGRFHRVPILFGNNGQEGRLFVSPTLTAAEYPGTLAGYAKAANRPTPGVLLAYPLKDYATPADGAAAAYGDANFDCTDRRLERWFSRFVPTFEYEFNDDADGTAPLGPTHGTELKYLFGVTYMGPILDGAPATLPPSSRALSLAMRQYWTAFAQHGIPNHRGIPIWRPAASGNIQMLTAPRPQASSGASFDLKHKCGYWN